MEAIQETSSTSCRCRSGRSRCRWSASCGDVKTRSCGPRRAAGDAGGRHGVYCLRHARPQLPLGGRQAGQRADHDDDLPGRLLRLAGDAQGADERRSDRRGEPTFEKSEAEDKIFTWPDLVFSEFICMVLLTVVMVVWSIALPAPLEEPANPSVAPNPSKAPWYFLGLQEMLVYFDPWMAGVVLPSLIILGLMAIPYHRHQPEGQRLLHLQGAQAGDHHLLLRLPDPVDRADRHRHLPARAELELLRAVRVLGRQQDRAAGQRRPVGGLLDQDARHRTARALADPRGTGLILVLLYFVALPVGWPQGLLQDATTTRWAGALLRRHSLFLTMMMMPIKMYCSLDVQPEVLRPHSGVLLQHLVCTVCRHLPRNGPIVTTTSRPRTRCSPGARWLCWRRPRGW